GFRWSRIRSKYCSVRPVSRMSSTTITVFPSMPVSRSLLSRTCPEDFVSFPGHSDEIERHFPADLPRQFRKKEYRALQNSHQNERLIGKILPNLLAHLLDPFLDSGPRDQHAHALIPKSQHLAL